MSDIYVEQDRFQPEGKGHYSFVLCTVLFLSLVCFCLSVIFYKACAEDINNPIFLVFNIDELIGEIVFLCLAFNYLVLSILWFTDYWSKIRICRKGVLIKYPYFFMREKMIPWQEFQIVSICTYFYHSRVYSDPILFVCMVKHGAKKNRKGAWKIMDPLYFSSVIHVWYTNELVRFLQEECGVEVVDQRGVDGKLIEF